MSELIDAVRRVRAFVYEEHKTGEIKYTTETIKAYTLRGLSDLLAELEREDDAHKVDMDAARRGWDYLAEHHQVYKRGDFDQLDAPTKHVYGLFAKGVLAGEPEPEPRAPRSFNQGDVIPSDVGALRDAFGDDLTRDQDGRWRYGLSFAPGWATDFTLTDSVCLDEDQYPLVEISLSEAKDNE